MVSLSLNPPLYKQAPRSPRLQRQGGELSNIHAVYAEVQALLTEKGISEEGQSRILEIVALYFNPKALNKKMLVDNCLKLQVRNVFSQEKHEEVYKSILRIMGIKS